MKINREPEPARVLPHVGEIEVVVRVATDETGEPIAGGSVMQVVRRQATDETGEPIGGGSIGTETWCGWRGGQTPPRPDSRP